jgi:hypothetical protein
VDDLHVKVTEEDGSPLVARCKKTMALELILNMDVLVLLAP